jgi:hypothetical protein
VLFLRAERSTVKDADAFNRVERAKLRDQQETVKVLLAATAEEDLPNIFKDDGEGESERSLST